MNVNEGETRNLEVIQLKGRGAQEHYSAFLKVDVRNAFCVQQKSNPTAEMKIRDIMEQMKILSLNNITLSDIGDDVRREKEWENCSALYHSILDIPKMSKSQIPVNLHSALDFEDIEYLLLHIRLRMSYLPPTLKD